ncbi:hypothetical protein [Nitrospirillum sp. BR 11828]|uniref:hypothetical protein n=1 Tax=Nitrospirillum sp. BR 11828 TaxID=3104325 RepID=UPI002ACA13A6|nr:hypothetical protein [Nitrospirillum sp. BR 11828]MDZ5648706.1 hypothetical protein [Nitrospirillum sp. BR 11828]
MAPEHNFINQQIFSAENVMRIREYCLDNDTICFGASVAYITCYQQDGRLMIHVVANCLVIGLGHGKAGLALQLAAPLGDGNYIRMAETEVTSLMIALPCFEGPVIAFADNRYIGAIRDFFNTSSDASTYPSPPRLRLVKP